MTAVAEDPAVSRHSETADSCSGVLLLDKPSGITSHDAVDIVRRRFNTRRVGHAGTLDPMASGLLLIMVGRATKIARYLTGLPKTYTATIRFGWMSTTGDAEGELQPDGDVSVLTDKHVASAVAAHHGRLTQVVPAYAAKRSQGQRRYELARAGGALPEMTHQVIIHSIQLTSWNPPDATIRVECSSGTYIRSLAESIGRAVNCGGYVTALRREAIGRWTVGDADTIENLDQSATLHSIDDVLTYPRLVLIDDCESVVAQGQPIRRRYVNSIECDFSDDDIAVLSDPAGRVLAIGRVMVSSTAWSDIDDDATVFRYERVLL
ncbi:MAG: tRNA pseudouridine(55) synthase TruB [candidate division Zixibacteria bacterium]|nr:tRNA pseudouridine(55) synthase TruB [candidate division Zixibacteria bacterium]